jgi:phosphoribosyl 1,2-cyclic phosphate phosphodiesterase
MRRRKEKRDRTALMISGEKKLLIDCGPDTASQLSRNNIGRPNAVLISHEHGDHFIGLDELFSYKRSCPRGEFSPIPVYLTEKSWEVVRHRFDYLVELEVIDIHIIEPEEAVKIDEFVIIPFQTHHGSFVTGSVGFIIEGCDTKGEVVRVVYTSDFVDIRDPVPALLSPDYLVIQSFWLNEPVVNRPHHMSFQRAIKFIELWKPKKETFLVHIGDGDMVPGDPANKMLKKYEPADPLKRPGTEEPYPIPLNQRQWQETVDQILLDRHIPFKVTVAHDDLQVTL